MQQSVNKVTWIIVSGDGENYASTDKWLEGVESLLVILISFCH